MKYISTIVSLVALGLVAVLYLAQNREITRLKKQLDGPKTAPSGNSGSFKIAYFDLDTLQERYQLMKDAKNEDIAQTNEMNQDLASRDRRNQEKIQEWKQRGNTMTQAEVQDANQQLQQMQQEFANHKQELEQKLYKFEMDKRLEIRKKIEDFIQEYNKGKSYAYIIAYDNANSFIYNKDTLYNITNDLVEGLNASYKKPK
jgi:outer membrane protein